MIQIDLANRQSGVAVGEARLSSAVEMVLVGESFAEAVISLAIVTDPTIRDLNRRFLAHDEPTDVLSFVFQRRPGYLEGEIIASGETAAANAARFGWSVEDELLLYVIHGTLHLAGYDDASPEALAEMRARERTYLSRLGLEPRYDDEATSGLPSP